MKKYIWRFGFIVKYKKTKKQIKLFKKTKRGNQKELGAFFKRVQKSSRQIENQE